MLGRFNVWNYFTSRNEVPNLSCVRNKRNSQILPNAIEAFTYIKNENESKIVMIKEFRATLNSWIYSFPAGLIEKGESAEDALIREVSEEIGGEIKDFKFLQNYPVAMCVGVSDESNMLAVVELNELKEQHLDEGENIQVVSFNPKELKEKIVNNELKLTASGLLGVIILLQKFGFYDIF